MGKKIGVVVVILVAVVCAGAWLGERWIWADEPTPEGALSEGAGAESIFLMPPKPELEQEVAEVMRRISTDHPISKEQLEQLIRHMLSYSRSGFMDEEAIRQFVRALGIGAIPTLAEKALDTDPEVRYRALVCLGYLMARGGPFDENYAEVEQPLLVWFLRSLRDVDPLIRGGCTGGLYRIARRRWPDPPPRALSALVVSAVEDPDESVRVAALRGLRELGLPIKHPRLPDSLWLD